MRGASQRFRDRPADEQLVLDHQDGKVRNFSDIAKKPALVRLRRLGSKGDLHGEWDSDRLTQVISNLVANALQYRCEDGAVRVVAQAQTDEVVLRVHNEGPPISEDAMKKIFEPMTRQPAQNGDKHPSGLGLGLYIAREIVTAHGGTIAVASAASEGTIFTVQIPRRLPKKRPPV